MKTSIAGAKLSHLVLKDRIWDHGSMVELPEDQAQEVLKLVDKLEQDEDVQKVFHNLQ